MTREPPAEVQRQLRREVNYCCPVPDCGEPFLTWHHFDPPWRDEQHHRPEGIIALCWKHHLQAESGVFGVTELQEWKRFPNSDEFAKAKFDWFGSQPLIRLGGCYASTKCLISVNDEAVLRVDGERDRLDVAFVLKSDKNQVLARMERNALSFDADRVHDLSVSASGHKIKIWLAERSIGIELEYSRRTINQIEQQIQADMPRLDDLPFEVEPPEPIEDIGAFYRELSQLTDFATEIAPIGFRRRDPVGTFVRWRVAQRIEKDGKVPLLDFKNCRLHSGGRTIEMRHGRFEDMEFCAATKFDFGAHGWGMS